MGGRKKTILCFMSTARVGMSMLEEVGINVCAVKRQCEPYVEFPVVCENHFVCVVLDKNSRGTVSSPFSDHFLS